jgi:hypothetical protein
METDLNLALNLKWNDVLNIAIRSFFGSTKFGQNYGVNMTITSCFPLKKTKDLL